MDSVEKNFRDMLVTTTMMFDDEGGEGSGQGDLDHDDRVVSAIELKKAVPPPHIFGSGEGESFDFEFPFPTADQWPTK